MSRQAGNKCVYFNCKKSRRRCPGIKLFRFPYKDQYLLNQWIVNSGNSSLLGLSAGEIRNKYLCWDHFDENSYASQKRVRLSKTAIPRNYLDFPSSSSCPNLNLLMPTFVLDPEEVSYTAGSEQVINGNSTSSDSLIIPSVSGNDVNIKATSSSWHQSILTYERNRLSSDSDAVAVGQDKIIDTSSINVDIDISDDTFQDGLSSTACFYLEPMKMPSPVSLSSEESHLSLSDNEIGSADEEIIVAKYPVNSNIHFEQDKELPLIESLKCDLNRLSNLCAKRKKIVNELNETKRRNEMDIQNLKQELDDLYKAFSEKKSQEIGNIKSSDLTKRPKRRRFLFKKAHSPAESLSLTLNVSSRRTCESIKRAGVLTIDVDGSGKNITFLKSSIR